MGEQEVYEQAGVAMTCRSYEEYVNMFALDEVVIGQGPVLDVAAGASSFTAELRRAGIPAVAADPLYALSAEAIAEAGRMEISVSQAKLEKLDHLYDWTHYGTMENYRGIRERSLELFAEDYAQQQGQGTYLSAMLPNLPFEVGTFRLVVCSHFLFLYGRAFDANFHRQAIAELLRVCARGGQVRIYPLVDLHWNLFDGLGDLLDRLRRDGFKAELLETKLKFIPKSTHLLSICKPPK